MSKILELLERYKLRIPPTVYYELKADVVELLEDIESEIKHHSEHFINDDGDDCLAVYEDDVFEIIDKYTSGGGNVNKL